MESSMDGMPATAGIYIIYLIKNITKMGLGLGILSFMKSDEMKPLTDAQAVITAEKRRELHLQMKVMKERIDSLDSQLIAYAEETGSKRIGCLKVIPKRLPVNFTYNGKELDEKEDEETITRIHEELLSKLPEHVKRTETVDFKKIWRDADTDKKVQRILKNMNITLHRNIKTYFQSI